MGISYKDKGKRKKPGKKMGFDSHCSPRKITSPFKKLLYLYLNAKFKNIFKINTHSNP
jgi:hypothetical protein